jgi:Transposase DDE domain
MGFRGQVCRNTLAHANEHRDCRTYADFAQLLIATARDLYRDEPCGVELFETLYAFDSTTIDWCLELFPWGKFRRHHCAVKLHTLLDLRGSSPTNVFVTGGQVNDVNILDQFLEAGAFYSLDRDYMGFARLHIFTQACAFFITRARKDLQFYRRYSRPVERSAGLRCDQTILLTGVRTAKHYPDPLRRIHYFDVEKDLRLTTHLFDQQFSSLRFDHGPTVPGTLRRWNYSFAGSNSTCASRRSMPPVSEDSSLLAVSVYVLVAIVKKQLGLEPSLAKTCRFSA